MSKHKKSPDTTMIDKARQLHEIRSKIDSLEAEAKLLEEQAVPLERELIDHIVDTFGEDENGKVDGGSFDISSQFKAILTTKTHPRILDGCDGKVHAWLRAKGYPSAVREYCFPQTFKSILKEISEKQDVDIKDIVNRELLGLVDAYVDRRISFRRKG